MASNTTSDFRRLKVSDRFASNASHTSNSFYPLRMTADHKVEMYVKFAKVMLIFQGPVTEERRGAVSELTSKFKYAGRLVSDETFTRETNRLFSPENTSDFYAYFRSRAKKSCEDGYNLIIIDQSMNNCLQMQYYFYLAQTMQYVILPYPPLVEDPYGHSEKRNTQAVEFKLETKSFVGCENYLKHLFCGWFLHDVDSAELRDEAGLYVQDCFDNIIEFKELFSKLCKPCEFASHYNMVNKRQSLAFCAVKLLHGLMDVKTYFDCTTFKKFYGSMSKLFIIGFIISPHMIAARVKLTYEQRKVWQIPELDEKCEVTVFPSALLKSCNVDFLNEEVKLIASKSNRTIISGEPIDKPMEVGGRSAHILLGKVENAPLRNVDYDASFALHREKVVAQKYSKNHEPYDLERCLVRRIGKYWFIYLKETLIVNGLFTTCCSVES